MNEPAAIRFLAAPTPYLLPATLSLFRPVINRAHAAGAALFGVPGFFVPRPLPPLLAPDGSMAALSYYDTQPLRTTLMELIEFDFINQKQVHLSLGAANVSNGNSVYFDNTKMRIAPRTCHGQQCTAAGFPARAGRWRAVLGRRHRFELAAHIRDG